MILVRFVVEGGLAGLYFKNIQPIVTFARTFSRFETITMELSSGIHVLQIVENGRGWIINAWAPYSYMDGDPSIRVRVATSEDQLNRDLCMSFGHNKRFICAILQVNPMIEMAKTNLGCGFYLL